MMTATGLLTGAAVFCMVMGGGWAFAVDFQLGITTLIFGSFMAILARMSQASDHHRELKRMLSARD